MFYINIHLKWYDLFYMVIIGGIVSISPTLGQQGLTSHLIVTNVAGTGVGDEGQ